MKEALIVLLFFNINCSTKSNDKNYPKTEKSVITKDNNHTNKSEISGIWGEKNADFATFQITPDSICYVDQGCFKLNIRGKTIKIQYDDFVENYQYELDSRNQILVLRNKEIINKFYRF